MRNSILLSFVSFIVILPPTWVWSQQTVKIETAAIGNINFKIPEGTTLTKAAEEPLIRWPVAADWDDDGNLVVVECHWDGSSVEDQLTSQPHKLVRLSDLDGDGVFDQRTVVAENLSFCEGVLVEGNQAWVTTPPTIQLLTDDDADGIYDERKLWHDGGTLTYCANDLHGPMRGRDGWLYWTKGAFGEQEVPSPDGSVRKSKASHIYRQHPDGRQPEIVVTAGMDNPADLGFLPNGDLLFCGTFFHHPSSGKRDGIAHGIYGSVFGKDHHVLDDHFKTGPLMKPIAELGPAAPAALLVLEGKQREFGSYHFSDANADDSVILSAQFNLQAIGVHRLTPNQGTYLSQDEILLSGDRVDFHPVDILPDKDGSLLILDTGGWYDLCCPSSGVDDQVAPGGIYRLQIDKPDTQFATSDDEELAKLWKHIRNLTAEEQQRSDWEVVAAGIKSEDEQLAAAAAHAVSLYRCNDLLGLMEIQLRNENSSLKRWRSFAEGVGRMDPGYWRTATEYLFDALPRFENVRSVEHSILIALNELCRTPELQSRLRFGSTTERWAAAQILSYRMAFRETDWQPLLEIFFGKCPNEDLLLEIFQSRPQFGSMLAPQVVANLELALSNGFEDGKPSLETIRLAKLIGACRSIDEVQLALLSPLLDTSTLTENQQAFLALVLKNCGGESIPSNWVVGIENWLRSANFPDVKNTIVPALQGINWTLPRDQGILDELVDQLRCYPEDTEFQLQVLECLPDQMKDIPDKVGLAIAANVVSKEPDEAQRAAQLLSKLQLREKMATPLLEALPELPPQEFRFVVRALLRMDLDSIDKQILELTTEVPTFETIPKSELATWTSQRNKESKQAWQSAIDSIYRSPDNIEQEVNRWLAELPEGDPAEGYNVFRSAKATCSSCHQVAYVGGRLGPNLSQIGHSRSPKDLLEAILFPSQRIEQSYQATQVLTADSKVFNGKVIAEDNDILELQCNADEKCRIHQDDIITRSESKISLMPKGLEKSLSKQEMADLLAFLVSRR